MNLISHRKTEKGINVNFITFHIDGGGNVTGSHLYLHGENMTIDDGGVLNAGKYYIRIVVCVYVYVVGDNIISYCIIIHLQKRKYCHLCKIIYKQYSFVCLFL